MSAISGRDSKGSFNMGDALIRRWWMIIGRGAGLIIAGVLSAVWAEQSAPPAFALFGAVIAIDGTVVLFASLRVAEHGLWLAVQGIFALLVALATLGWPAPHTLVLRCLVAAWLVASGALEIFVVAMFFRIQRGRWWVVLAGVGSILVGATFVPWPVSSANYQFPTIGILAASLGTVLFIIGGRLRRLGRPADIVDGSRVRDDLQATQPVVSTNRARVPATFAPRESADNETVLDGEIEINSLVLLVNGARSPEDFTDQYDDAVDELEDEFTARALQALGRFEIAPALEAITKARHVRLRYLELLEQSESSPEHPMSSRFPALRSYARDMGNIVLGFKTVLEALTEYQRGNGQRALSLLDRLEPLELNLDSRVGSLLSLNTKTALHNITGLIRRGVLDLAGARAAFDRAAAVANVIYEFANDLDDSDYDEGKSMIILGSSYSRWTNEASSLRVQYQQMMNNVDYVGAIDAAKASSAAYLEAAKLIEGSPIEFFAQVSPFLRASSFESLAEAAAAEAYRSLEQGDWTAAEAAAKAVRDNFQAASVEVLKSQLPVAVMTQERYLNVGFSWVIQFRRELARERTHAEHVENLQRELRSLLDSMRGALSPAGVVVNNATEMVTSVRQQVEVTSRLEANIRSMLREIPDALRTIELSAPDREALIAEALRLADDRSDRTGFFAKVRIYGKKLGTMVGSAAEIAAPVLALLKALSIL